MTILKKIWAFLEGWIYIITGHLVALGFLMMLERATEVESIEDFRFITIVVAVLSIYWAIWFVKKGVEKQIDIFQKKEGE